MDTSFLFGISLTASFLAGIMALFAPCCITFLFPSYLGTVFKEQKRVMFYTLIFALGLSFILVPISLGIRSAIYFLDAYHTQIYYLGALIMIVMSISVIKPLFHLPQIFHVDVSGKKEINTASVFGLGLMSGLTSACCAPVLFAAITLTSLSPTMLQAVIVSFAYVLGIVMPLFVLSIFYEKLPKKFSSNREKISKVFKVLAALIFLITGILIAIFNYQGKIQMNQMEPYSQTIRLVVFEVAKYFKNPILDIFVFSIVVFIFIKLLRYKGTNDQE